MKPRNAFLWIAAFIVAILVLSAAAPGMAATSKAEVEKVVQTGQTVDISVGSCGAYLINLPQSGNLKIEREARVEHSLRFVRNVCSLSYTDLNEKLLTSYPGSMVYYINLTGEELAMWEDGELAFYTQDGSGWSTCSANLASGGAHGRLVCWTKTIGMYGLVDLREKEEDEEEEQVKHKVPAGDPIAAGGSMDLIAGKCSALLASAPEAGFVDLHNGCIPYNEGSLKFVQRACELTYKDPDNRNIKVYGGPLAYSFQLTKNQQLMWQDGELALYTFDGKDWSPCEARLVATGESNSLVCQTNNVGMFGLVDLSVKEEDEE